MDVNVVTVRVRVREGEETLKQTCEHTYSLLDKVELVAHSHPPLSPITTSTALTCPALQAGVCSHIRHWAKTSCPADDCRLAPAVALSLGPPRSEWGLDPVCCLWLLRKVKVAESPLGRKQGVCEALSSGPDRRSNNRAIKRVHTGGALIVFGRTCVR